MILILSARGDSGCKGNVSVWDNECKAALVCGSNPTSKGCMLLWHACSYVFVQLQAAGKKKTVPGREQYVRPEFSGQCSHESSESLLARGVLCSEDLSACTGLKVDSF